MKFDKEQAFLQAANIIKFYEVATPEEIEGGLVWYSNVREMCLNMAQTFAVSLKQVAGVLAVLSPNTPWNKNVDYTIAAVEHFRVVDNHMGLFDLGVRTFYGNVEKAYKILTDKDYSLVSGKKVRSFWKNIWNVDSMAITHDVHSRRVVFNDVQLVNKGMTERQYNTAVQAYWLAFDMLSADNERLEYPYQLQAITWEVARRLKNEGVVSL